VSVRVDGPAEIPPGERAQYTATARYSDGSSRDVTNEAQWSTSDDSVLAIDGSGAVVARAAGDAQHQAVFGNATQPAVRSVLVIPAGRFRLSVSVVEDQVTAPIFDVRVEVISGPAAGLTATTNWSGTAILYGVSADAELRLTKDGYRPLVRPVHLERHSALFHVQMFPSGGRLDLPGEYQLTISSGTCTGDGHLPEAVKTRTYVARLWNAGLMIHLALDGADFAVEWCKTCNEYRGNHFLGQTQALDARFTLREYVPPEVDDYYGLGGVYPDVAERLPDGTLLSISGRVVVTPTVTGLAGTLDGSFAIYDSLSQLERPGRALASCQSDGHRFTLVRMTAGIG
jgi:hypothetical protein